MFFPDKLAGLGGARLKSVSGNRAVFEGDAGEVQIIAHGPGVFRATLGDFSLPDYPMVVGREECSAIAVGETAAAYICRAGEYSLAVGRGEHMTFSLSGPGGEVLPVTQDAHFVRRFRLPPLARTKQGWFVTLGLPFDHPVYGGGEKFGQLNRRGLLMDLWNEDALGANSAAAYKNCPFLWSPGGWGVFVNTSSRLRVGVGYPEWSNHSLCLDVPDKKLDIFFIAAESPAGILERYTALTGRSEPAPLWSLGLWLSKAYYRTPDETLAAASIMREKDIPCDVITIDGRAWQDTDTRFHFYWDPSRYADPKAFCAKLKALGYKICVWEYPLVSVNHPRYQEYADKGYFLLDAAGKPYRYEFDPTPFGEVLTQLPPSGLIDFTNPEAYEFWKNEHRRIFEQGVDAIKSDFGEQVLEDMRAFNGDDGGRLHNIYSLLYNLCVYEASREYHGANALNWSRSGWAGSQRAPMQWAGDTGSTWHALTAAILGGLSWGMSGCPYYSTDIGGFYGDQPDPELFSRWTQAAVFCSHMRYHGIGPREPWAYGPEAEKVCRAMIGLRYRLIPYLQECCAAAAQSGLPVMRSMALAFPGEAALWSFETQYMLGDSIFAAPVLRPGGRVRYRLPLGLWRDFWTGAPRDGGVTVEETVPLDRMPVYVREGTLMPVGPVVRHTGELTEKNRLAGHVPYGPVCSCALVGKKILAPDVWTK